MTKSEHFEKLQLTSRINPIVPDMYPGSFPLHWHQYVEIIALPTEAQPTTLPRIMINQTVYTLNPGDVVFVWAGELHEIVENREHLLTAMQFAGNLISELPEFIPYLNAFRSIHCVDKKTFPDLSHKLQQQLERMLLLKNSHRTFADIEMLICLYNIFIDFGSYIETQHGPNLSTATGCSHQTLEKMNQACNYIIENCEQPLTLESVADQFGFSIYYFSRIFKLATSFNFTEYLTLQRIKRAQAQLADSDLNITEIAFQAGFKSISSFNRAFKQFKGCSPSEYRKYHSPD